MVMQGKILLLPPTPPPLCTPRALPFSPRPQPCSPVVQTCKHNSHLLARHQPALYSCYPLQAHNTACMSSSWLNLSQSHLYPLAVSPNAFLTSNQEQPTTEVQLTFVDEMSAGLKYRDDSRNTTISQADLAGRSHMHTGASCSADPRAASVRFACVAAGSLVWSSSLHHQLALVYA